MSDEENKTAEQLAAELNSPQIEQVAPTDDGAQSPASVPATRDELILGKFKTQEDFERSYLELERNFTTSRQAREVYTPPVPSLTEAFEPETVSGIRSIAWEVHEEERANEFARKHREELADPLLRAVVLNEIREANVRGEIMDQETALENAKRALDARVAPKVEQASKTSFDEGQAIARRKEQASAVGSTSVPTPDVDIDSLTSEEYANHFGIPHA